jgi:hypothetical protein
MEDKTATVIKDLGDGLVLRFSTAADADRLAEFNSKIHGEDPYDAVGVAEWTRDLLLKPHPTFQKGDFVIVEKAGTGEIVSSMNLISQTWLYDGIPFGVGRPELVGTLPEYRNRGLVRAQFDAIHELSHRRGELVQAITGIPYFYRQFGYEMTVDLGGSRAGPSSSLPKLEEGKEEPFRIRPAKEEDIPFLLRMIERNYRRSLLSCRWDEALLRHELLEKRPQNVNRLELRVIETPEGQPVGFLAHPNFTWWGQYVVLMLYRYELEEGYSYLAVTPSVLRYLWSTAQVYAAERERAANAVGFSLGIAHPAYQAAGNALPIERKPYAYYMRVPDLPAFLHVIAPVLEQRLRESDFTGHTGEIKLSFFRTGVHMVFEAGRITSIEAWKPVDGEASATFPALTFLHLLFGHRTLDEVRHIYVDCWANDPTRALLGVLFPRKPSSIWPVS